VTYRRRTLALAAVVGALAAGGGVALGAAQGSAAPQKQAPQKQMQIRAKAPALQQRSADHGDCPLSGHAASNADL
jgi:hypothetical protein